jgi:hypothetical protein
MTDTDKGSGSTGRNAAPAFTPSDAERELVRDFDRRRQDKAAAPQFKVDFKPPNNLIVTPDHPDRSTGLAAFYSAFGTTDPAFADWLFRQLMNAGCQGTQSKPPEAKDLNGAAAAMAGIAPQNETEAMLAAQMVAVHAAAMGQLQRLKNTELLRHHDCYGNLATKFLRTYAAQVEALQRLRGKGQQTVRVEHVTVKDGGQAIVGTVTGGTGRKEKSEEQPDAKQLTHAPGETLPSDIQAHAETVSVTVG